MNPDSNNINDYLVSDKIINWKDDAAIISLAHRLTVDESDEVTKARILFEWVRDNISHSNDIKSEIVTCIASDVLKYRTGICYAKSHLLAALLRSIQIPAGFCYQVTRKDSPNDNEFGLHGFNGIYLATLGRWIRVDARGNTNKINAQFSIEKEQLAFPFKGTANEFIYDSIFSKPKENVTEKLLKYKTSTELLRDLPKPF